MRALAMIAALATIACCTPPAHAATGSFEVPVRPDGTIPLLAGPRPAGDAIAYAEGSADGGWTVRLGAPGTGTRVLQTLAPAKGLSVALSASATRIAVTEHAVHCTDCRYMQYEITREALTVAPLGGAPVTLARCEGGSACSAVACRLGGRYATALSDDLLAVHDLCTRTVDIIDLATAATRELGAAEAVAVGGRYVALARPATATHPQETIVVHDADTGAEVYRAGIEPPGRGVGFIAAPGAQVAVRADGVVVYTSPAAGREVALVVASAQLPAGRVIRTMPARTALLGVGAGGALLTTDSPSRLHRVALDGTAAAPLDLPDLLGTAGFDGRTIAWARRTCATATITSWRLGDAAPPAADLRCPTPVPVRRTATLPRDRRLAVAFDCPATARGGCRAVARLTAERRGRAGRHVNGATRLYRLGRIVLTLDPGARGRSTLLVPAGAARWVRRHAPVRLRIEVASESERAAQRPAGDGGVSARTVTLRAAR